MALNVNAAKLYNRIIYTTDKNSLAKVKKEMQQLRESMTKSVKPLVDARAEIAAAKKVTKAVKEEVAKQQKAYKITMPKSGSGRGTGMVGNATWNAQDSATYARQTRQMYDNRAAAEKALEAQRKKADAAAAKRRKDALNRDLKATMALRKAAFDINRLQGQSGAERYKNVQQARDITKAFREGRIELVEMNEQMRQLRANAGAAARNARKMARNQGQPTRTGNSQYLLGLGLVSAGVAGVAGAGYATYRNLDTASTKAHNLNQLQNQSGVNPNTLLAMVQWGQQNGVNSASVDKLADNMKDVDERTGEFVSNAKRNKAGEWTGGGQWTEAANVLKLTMDQIKELQGKPVEALNLIANRGKQLGLSESQIKHLMENMADDASLYYRMYSDDGKALVDTMRQRNADGLSYSTSDLSALENMYQFNLALKQGTESLQNKFVVGLAQSITGTDDLKEAFTILRPQVLQLGEAMGTLLNGILKLIEYLPTTKVNEVQQQLKDGGLTMANGQTVRSDGSWRDWIPAPIQDLLGVGANAVSPSTLFNRNNMVMAGMGLGYGNPSQQLVFSPQLSVTPEIMITPDSSGFSSLIDARAGAAITTYERNLTLSMYGSTTNNNN
ncbi:hypothetical protein [Serratia rhizosphaerae]|uniref:hypothetical protein n=1 Tax=Serratia rhizosphaerae TaxID=2597702 RepID=UPI002DC045A1|nr:hypothetical protein [Serratia rhizosphaerae]MEB6337661.1 hypothetical protein [Serratia rhizosphaerae]